MKDSLYDLPKAIDRIRNPPLPSIENVEDSSDLEAKGVKIIISSNIIDIYTRLEISLGLKLLGHTDNLTESSNLIGELFKEVKFKTNNNIENLLTNFKYRYLQIFLYL